MGNGSFPYLVIRYKHYSGDWEFEGQSEMLKDSISHILARINIGNSVRNSRFFVFICVF